LLIDTGAGLGQAVLAFIGASDEVIIVITPEPSSMADAYGLLKWVKAQMKPKNINIIVNRIKNEKKRGKL
jgi:flagellar biosynthesis protein FlhG